MEKTVIQAIYYNIYSVFFPNYYNELDKELTNNYTILDVGCGDNSPLIHCRKRGERTGVDIHEPSIEISKNKNIHDKYICCDVLDIDKHFQPNSVDIVLASDLIEHLPKPQGYELMEKMETIARHKVIIFTPNGLTKQEPFDGNEYQRHLSGWDYKEMVAYGYDVIGINGFYKLRTERARIRFKPFILWLIISDITQHITKRYPRLAYQILCVKKRL